jgi:ABC-type glycerol-3-phosphate transport system substrate-binding protein
LPKVLEIWQEAAQTFEKDHPGVKVEFDYLENEAFKAKLPTLLQSKDRPSLFHSWGGGVMIEQINAGVVEDITSQIEDIQDKIAASGQFIPVVKGTADFIQEPFYKAIAQEVANTQWIQIAMDQLLGSDTGRVFNDACADIADGKMTAEKAAKTIQTSWEQNKQ